MLRVHGISGADEGRWTGKFCPENLEHPLNSYAAEGWRVVSSVPVPSMWSISTSQIMILLERETPASRPAPSLPRRPPGHYTGTAPIGVAPDVVMYAREPAR
jgi:hypothetical protein